MTYPSSFTIVPPAGPLVGRVTLPGSKSITNRALLVASLAAGTSRITGALKSRDTALMAAALREMRVSVDEPDAGTFVVTGTGRLEPPGEALFLGNAGTATRFLTAAAALVDGVVTVDGDEDMRRRPIAPLVEALGAMGVRVDCPTGCPPVRVHGRGGLSAARVDIDGRLSSQFVSALLMIAPFGDAAIEVALRGEEIGARGYVDLTVAVMREFGASVEPIGSRVWRVHPTRYRAADLTVEPDASAATYHWAAGALTGGRIDIGRSLQSSAQPDARAADVIARFPHLPAVIDGSQMQDAVPTLAVLSAFNQTAVRFTGIRNLRVKECDRVHALATELSRIRPGLASEDVDDLVVHADPELAGQRLPTRIETYKDHRIAMALALAGLKIDGLTVLDPACVDKTYPTYWQDLASVGVSLRPGH